MEPTTIIAVALLAYLAAVLSPGPNFAVVSRLSLNSSRSDGLAATLGIALASGAYALLTLLGVSALLRSAPWMGDLLTLLGGCFLIYLGVRAWLKGPSGVVEDTTTDPAPRRGSSLRTGLLVAFSNPKAIAFFAGLYAVIIPPDAALWVKGTILLASFVIEFGWYALVALLLSSPPAQRLYRRHARWIERAFGALLVGIGVRFIAGLV